MATLWRLLLCWIVVSACCQRAAHGAIRSRTLPLGNHLLTGERSLAQQASAHTTATTTTTTTIAPATNAAAATERDPHKVTKDFSEKLSWQCVSNASCLYALANSVMASYRRGETLKLGFMELVKVPAKPFSGETGRGVASSLMQFINGNAVRVPVGPMVFSVQRANTEGDYIELALLKKATASGARLGGGDEGHGVLQKIRQRHQDKHDKKQFQMFIPMYLAATTFGWTLVVAKAVAMLTLKALVVSKLAFLVAAMVIIKKMMDNASEKMMYTYPEHQPYMMPYGMDYPMHPMGELSAGPELYPAALQLAAAGAAIGQPSHPGYDGLNAESSFQHNVAADVQNNTHVLAALNAASMAQKVKRDDSWLTNPALRRRPMVYNYLNQNPYLRP